MTSKVWEVMNDLEMVTAKIVSAREIIDTAAEAIQKHDYDKAETLAMAAYEFLGYYLEEFDEKFKLAWQETVVAQNKYEYTATGEKIIFKCDGEDKTPNWNSFWNSYQGSTVSSLQYTDEELNAMCDAAEKKDKVKKWVLPVEEAKDADTDETEYFVSFPDDLLETADLKEGDQVEWVDQGDGSYMLRKVTKPLGPDEC